MTVGPSGQDDKQLIEFAKNDCDYFIRGILNKKGDMDYSIAFFRNNYVINHVPWELDVPNMEANLEATIQEEIKAKVRAKTYSSPANAWQGGYEGSGSSEYSWNGGRKPWNGYVEDDEEAPGSAVVVGHKSGSFYDKDVPEDPRAASDNRCDHPLWPKFIAHQGPENWETFKKKFEKPVNGKVVPFKRHGAKITESAKDLANRISGTSFTKGKTKPCRNSKTTSVGP